MRCAAQQTAGGVASTSQRCSNAVRETVGRTSHQQPRRRGPITSAVSPNAPSASVPVAPGGSRPSQNGAHLPPQNGAQPVPPLMPRPGSVSNGASTSAAKPSSAGPVSLNRPPGSSAPLAGQPGRPGPPTPPGMMRPGAPSPPTRPGMQPTPTLLRPPSTQGPPPALKGPPSIQRPAISPTIPVMQTGNTIQSSPVPLRPPSQQGLPVAQGPPTPPSGPPSPPQRPSLPAAPGMASRGPPAPPAPPAPPSLAARSTPVLATRSTLSAAPPSLAPRTLAPTAPPGLYGFPAGGLARTGLDGLKRPDPPLRVLEMLVPQHDGASRPRFQVEVKDEGDAPVEDDFLEKKVIKKRVAGRKAILTSEMKRNARKIKKETREEKILAGRRDKEEIFEVGEEGMSLIELADIVQVDPSDIVRTLFMKGITLSMNQVLDKNTVKVVAAEYDLVVVDKEEEAPGDKTKKRTDGFVTDEDVDDLVLRPPVVTVMGHVDHGKTSLLDVIRSSRVAAGEAGGITQGIGAYNTTVEVDGEEKTICFLDTPGHEAFSAMRARGAQVTDVAIIIVAADDGVRPQTREAVAHAQAAKVPILVAINKIDKPGADIERVKQELLELNLVAEEWGGTTPMVAVSAKKGTGIADLLQMVTWMAEEQKLMANPKKPSQGTVIESHLDRRVGPVATLLVQAGTLQVGNIVCAGASYGRVRTIKDDLGRVMTSAGPSIAVQMVGLDSTPVAGEEFQVVATESAARAYVLETIERFKAQRMLEMSGGGSMVTLSSLADMDSNSDSEAMQKINLIVKGDTMGVVEAIKSALSTLPQQSITLRCLLSGAGDISESDVDLAAASGALILGFNLEPDNVVAEAAKRLGVTIMTYKIIYNLLDDVKAAMEGKLKSVEEKVPLGKAEVKAVFGAGKKRVGGCMVLTGKLVKGSMVIVRRGKVVVHEGKMISLRRLKDIVEEVSEGFECGIGCEDFPDWQPGDTIECYKLVTKNRRLEDARATTAVDVSTLG